MWHRVTQDEPCSPVGEWVEVYWSSGKISHIILNTGGFQWWSNDVPIFWREIKK